MYENHYFNQGWIHKTIRHGIGDKKITLKSPAVVNYRWGNRQQLIAAGLSGS